MLCINTEHSAIFIAENKQQTLRKMPKQLHCILLKPIVMQFFDILSCLCIFKFYNEKTLCFLVLCTGIIKFPPYSRTS